LFSQSNSLEKEVVDTVIEGIETIAVTVINSAFTPMTDYEKGDLMFTASPGFFNIRKVYNNPEIRGDKLFGYTFGAGAGYALTDRLMAYGIFSGLLIDGSLEADFYGTAGDPAGADTNYQYYSLFSGMGYEVVSREFLSLPVYLGLNTGYYSLSLDPDSLVVSGFGSPVTTTVRTEGSGFLSGLSGGVAARFKYKGFSLAPYYLYMVNFNGTTVRSDITVDAGGLPLRSSVSHKIDPYMGGTFGFSAAYKTRKGWSFNLSLKNLFPWFTSDRDDAFDMTSAVFTVGYTG